MSCTGTATSNTITLPSYAPVNTVAPVISGTAVVGQTLTTTNGTWTNSPSSYSYQWKRGGVNISLATSSTYVLVAADAGTNITCQVTATNSVGSASATSNTLAVYASILDQYPSAAAAYSIRLLRGSRYDNALLRVRRSSDNAEVDVFVDSNYQLSLNSNITSRTSGTTLSTWIGSNNGFVVTWYDQSGSGRNAAQSTPVNQPQIVSSGSILTLNSKPSILFDGSNDSLVNISNLINTTNPVISTFIVINKTAVGSFSSPFMIGNVAGNFYFPHRSNSTTNEIQFRANGAASSTINSGVNYTSSQELISTTDSGSNINIFKNTNNIVNGTSSIGVFSENAGFNIGAVNGSASGLWTGNIQELIVYTSNQSTNRLNIQTNINSHYGIY